MTTTTQLAEQVELFLAENEKFEDKKNSAAGTRARKALMEIKKLADVRRKEIQAAKNEKK